MILTCPSCRKSFRTDPGQFGNGPRTVACGACRYQWTADTASLMTDQQFYQMRMGQLAAQQPAPVPQAAYPPMPSPAAPQMDAAPAPLAPQHDAWDEPVPQVPADTLPDLLSDDPDADVARAWEEMNNDAEGASLSGIAEHDPAGADDDLPGLSIDADDQRDLDAATDGKRRFGLFRRKKAKKRPEAVDTGTQETQKRVKPPRRRAGWFTWLLWVLFLGFVAALLAGGYLLSSKVMSTWPPAAHLYEKLGIANPPHDASIEGKGVQPGKGDPKTAEPVAKPAAAPEKASTSKSAPKPSGKVSGDQAAGQAEEDPKNKVGLTLAVVNVQRRASRPGRANVTAELQLKNITRRARIVPPVVIKFIDVNGETVFERRVNLLTGPVSPGAEKHTNVQIKDVPVSAMHLSATFDVPGAAAN